METYELVKKATSLAKSKKFDEAILLLNKLYETHEISDAEVIKIIPYYQKAGRYDELRKYCEVVLIPLVTTINKKMFGHKCKEIQSAFINLSICRIYNKLALCAKREKLSSEIVEFKEKESRYYKEYESNLATGEELELKKEYFEFIDFWGADKSQWPEKFKKKFSIYSNKQI